MKFTSQIVAFLKWIVLKVKLDQVKILAKTAQSHKISIGAMTYVDYIEVMDQN